MEPEESVGARLAVSAQELVKIQAEILAVGIFSDVRPLTGFSALVDWYHNGAISHLILSGKINGTLRERTLIASHPKFFSPKIMVVGLGSHQRLSESTLRGIYPFVFRTLATLNAQDIAVEMFGEELGSLASHAAIESLSRELRPDPDSRYKVTLLASNESRARQTRQLISEKGSGA
ncbi:MAG TPA: M17 family peptidase N-terminal domain-containing protein [Nitrospiria bacterium]